MEHQRAVRHTQLEGIKRPSGYGDLNEIGDSCTSYCEIQELLYVSTSVQTRNGGLSYY